MLDTSSRKVRKRRVRRKRKGTKTGKEQNAFSSYPSVSLVPPFTKGGQGKEREWVGDGHEGEE
jgi:hypothetical protein